MHSDSGYLVTDGKSVSLSVVCLFLLCCSASSPFLYQECTNSSVTKAALQAPTPPSCEDIKSIRFYVF